MELWTVLDSQPIHCQIGAHEESYQLKNPNDVRIESPFVVHMYWMKIENVLFVFSPQGCHMVRGESTRLDPARNS